MPGGTNLPVLPGLGCGSQTPWPYDAYPPIVHGMLTRIVPFLVWLHRFAPRIGEIRVPSLYWPLGTCSCTWQGRGRSGVGSCPAHPLHDSWQHRPIAGGERRSPTQRLVG